MLKISNAGAVFEVLSAGAEDPTFWRKAENRPAFRRLYRAAMERASFFPSHQQHSIRVWSLRIVIMIDLTTSNPEHFQKAVQEVKKRLQTLPCANPADEPPVPPGQWREYMPERTRPLWCNAIFDCLEVTAAKIENCSWARSDANMLIKFAADRRQNFSTAQQEALGKWEKQRKATAIKAHAGLS